MIKQKNVLILLVIGIVECFTWFGYSSIYRSRDIHPGMDERIFCHLFDLVIIGSIMFFFKKFKESTHREGKIYSIVFLLDMIFSYTWLYFIEKAPSHDKTSALLIMGDMILGTVLLGLFSIFISWIITLVVLTAINVEQIGKGKKLPRININYQTNNVVQEINRLPYLLKGRVFRKLQKDIRHYNAALEKYNQLPFEKRDLFEHEMNEMTASLEASLSAVLSEQREKQKRKKDIQEKKDMEEMNKLISRYHQ